MNRRSFLRFLGLAAVPAAAPATAAALCVVGGEARRHRPSVDIRDVLPPDDLLRGVAVLRGPAESPLLAAGWGTMTDEERLRAVERCRDRLYARVAASA